METEADGSGSDDEDDDSNASDVNSDGNVRGLIANATEDEDEEFVLPSASEDDGE